MGFTCGIVGLPNVGKSTLFNALVAGDAAAENYPFCTVDPNRGVVPLPDPRLDRLADLIQPEKVTPTYLEFLDIAGLVQGASRGEGLGNQFLAHIREVDAIVEVVRCFHDENIVHVNETVDPLRDMEIIETELILKDLETVSTRLQKVQRSAQVGVQGAREEQRLLERLEPPLAQGTPLRLAGLDEFTANLPPDLALLTAKPLLYLLNVSDEQFTQEDDPLLQAVYHHAQQRQTEAIPLCAQTEAELLELPPEERPEMLYELLGVQESGLIRLVQAGYRLLQLVTFFTVVGTETRAWTVPAHTPASKAAGKIHSDMERGFIRAEVIPLDLLLQLGSEQRAREEGRIASEGRDYPIQDGDVVRFRFNR